MHRTMRVTVLTACVLALTACGPETGPPAGDAARGRELDDALEAFWAADDAVGAAAAAAAVAALHPDFDALYARLSTGRPYPSRLVGDLVAAPLSFAPSGIFRRARLNARGVLHPYVLVVPSTYDPTRRYPVHVFLQSDTSRPTSSIESGVEWLVSQVPAREDAILVFPGAWDGLPWWSAAQVEHIAAVLDQVKRIYNVDENRVYLLGASNGGTAVYYHAMAAVTPWAAFLAFNSTPELLSYPEANVDAPLHPSNLANRPLWVAHGARDRIYPLEALTPWLGMFERGGADVTLRVQDEYGHETRWWSEEAPAMDAFMAAHPRDPLPDALTWAAGEEDTFARAHWLIIDELGTAAAEALAQPRHEVVPAAWGLGVGAWRRIEQTGMQLMMVQTGSLADAGDLREGDIIQQIGEVPVREYADVAGALERYRGAAVEMHLVRGGRAVTREVALPAPLPDEPREAFPWTQTSGRVELERVGNTVRVATTGVRRFTLLLSPDEFDFARSIRVVANGSRVFDGTLEPRVDVLLAWAARDNDRTMLFAQELTITLPEP